MEIVNIAIKPGLKDTSTGTEVVVGMTVDISGYFLADGTVCAEKCTIVSTQEEYLRERAEHD